MKKYLVPLLILIMVGGIQAEEKKKTTKEYIADLKSDDDAIVIKASKGLGDAKAKDAVETMIEVLKSHQNPKVRIALASGLSLMGTKDQPTKALSEVVQTDDDNSVVYASLLAILNLGDYQNPAAQSAVDYCEKNKTSDEYIADVVKKINEALAKNKKK